MDTFQEHMQAVDKSLLEIPCTKAVGGDSFTQGVQDFQINIGAPSVFKPSESYFRIACTVTQGGNQPSLTTGEVALADNFCASLYNQVSFRAGGQEVSSIQRYVGQADQIRTRISKTKAWQESVGKNAFMIEPDYETRRQIISYEDPTVTNDGTVAVDAYGLVTGTGTDFWDSGVRVGMIMTIAAVPYVIRAITRDADTTLTLTVPTGFTPIGAGATYTITEEEDRFESSKGRNRVYVLWKPSIGIFDNPAMLGAGQYTVSLNPNSDYKTAALQTLTSNTDASTYNLTIDDVRFYASTYKLDKPDSEELLTLNETDVQSKIIGDSGNVSSLQFTVPPSTYAVAVFFQSGDAGRNMINPQTLFKTQQTYPPLATDVDERSLQNIQITYAGMSRPAINWSNDKFTYDNTIDANTSTNQLQQRYVDTINETGMIYNAGGVESFADYLKRGLFVYYEFLKDVDNKATDLQLSCNLASGLPDNTRLFVASFYHRQVAITNQNGLVVSVVAKSV